MTMDSVWPIVLSLAVFLTTAIADRTTSERSRPSSKLRSPSVEPKTETRYKWEGFVPSEEDDGAGDAGRKGRAKCVDIPQVMGLCRGIGYLKMRLPNLLGHETLSEVQREAASWTPLLNTRCSNNTQLFLCSLFSPVCLDQPIWPCRSLCLEVRRGCEAPMASYGYPWPDMLDCQKLPSDNDLCIGIQMNRSSSSSSSSQESVNGQASCKICENITSSGDSAIDNFCRAQFVAKLKPEMVVISGNDLKIMSSKRVKFYKNPTSDVSKKRRHTFYVQDGSKCDCFDRSNSGQYIVMGRVRDKQRLTLTSVVKYDPRSKAGKQMLRTIKKSNGCSAANGRRKISDIRERRRVAIKQGKKRNDRKNVGVQFRKVGNKGVNKQKARQNQDSSRKRNSE